jgi:DNA-binding NarL/FixJ family response regulator
MTIKILLVDDHNIVREGLRSLLEKKTGMEVVGEADSGRTAVRLAQKLSPDVVLMDVTMPDLNGIEATRQIKSRVPRIKILGLSMHRDGPSVTEMLKAGASGYLPKTCVVEELVRAIRAVVMGQTYLNPEIAGIVAEACRHPPSTTDASATVPLTPRQCEVLQSLAEGLTTKQIALRLSRSAKTVEMHRRHTMDKLNLHSIAELTKYAVRMGLASLDA